MKKLLVVAMLLIFCGCRSSNINKKSKGVPYGKSASGPSLILIEKASDSTYGYTEQNPIKVGGGLNEGSKNEQMYLNALYGPRGQVIEYERVGSCCPFETPNGIMGGGLLDAYEVKYDGLKQPIILYLNLYDYEKPKIPIGFTGNQQ